MREQPELLLVFAMQNLDSNGDSTIYSLEYIIAVFAKRKDVLTRATSANRLQRQGHLLLVHACTSAWLRPCFYERHDRSRDR